MVQHKDISKHRYINIQMEIKVLFCRWIFAQEGFLTVNLTITKTKRKDKWNHQGSKKKDPTTKNFSDFIR